MLGGIVATVVTVGLPLWTSWASARGEQRAREYAVDLQQRYTVAVGHVVAPLTQQLAALRRCNGMERARQQGVLRSHILDAVLRLVGVREARVSLYLYNNAPNSQQRDLVYKQHLGRHDRPRDRFRPRGDQRERAVHRLVQDREIELVSDVTSITDASFFSDKPYRTYIAASVFAGDEPLGLLTVDAPEPDSLDASHKGTIKALASLLAAGTG